MSASPHRLPVRLFALIAAPAMLVGLGLIDPLAVLLAAPWLAAIVFVVARTGLDVVLGEDQGAFPSAADAARRRLAVR